MKKHPNKDIRAAIELAVQRGWQVVEPGMSAHCFCKLRCGIAGHTEHSISVWSTPRNPANHAKRIQKIVQDCPPAGE